VVFWRQLFNPGRMETNNYDAVASFYDPLSRLVFGKAQINAQVEQLKYVPTGARVLIVGGGTGWILEELAKVYPEGLNITYVEISRKMLDQAQKRKVRRNDVLFVHAAIEHFHPAEFFDVIITAFLFDNFSQNKADLVFNHLDASLKVNGTWLFSDFKVNSKKQFGWKQLMLKMMYLFFRLLARVEAKKLAEVEALFKAKNYQIISRKAFYQGFIESIIFRK